MATNKMKLRHLYRSGEHKFLEDNYGIVFGSRDESKADILQKATVKIIEETEIQNFLTQDEAPKNDDDLVERIEYLETLDIMQLRNLVKSTVNMPYKNLMKMKKEEMISELLK